MPSSPPGRTILALEPWLGGSHARMLETWGARSRHEVRVIGMPPRHWRWRMEASAWSLARMVRERGVPVPDVLFVSDYVDLSRLRGLLPPEWAGVPVILYMHENQLTYPSGTGGPASEPDGRDMSYGFTNALSCLAADAVVFNSAFHRADFRRACAELFARLPRPTPAREIDAALEAATVIGPGVELDALPLGPGPRVGAPLRVAFNHRWEHDKDPLTFLRAARAALDAGASLEVVLLGERFSELPAGAERELTLLEARIVHMGFTEDRAEYARLLGGCDVVVSTALHEFYGIAVLEGMALGCTPLLPDRLAYPETLPGDMHADCLYRDGELAEHLTRAAGEPRAFRARATRERARTTAGAHDVALGAGALDELCDGLVLTR